jgi:hypothetical protein
MQFARDGTMLCQGCPINNLAQEMSPLDKGFQKRIARICDEWRQSIASALENGIERGQCVGVASGGRGAAGRDICGNRRHSEECLES